MWIPTEILLTVWNVNEPPSSAYAALANEGYNLIPVHENVGLLVQAEAQSLKVLFSHHLIQPNSLYNPSEKLQLDALIDSIKGSSALAGYFLIDEPSSVYTAGYTALIDYLRERDPTRFALVNLFPIYATAEQMGVDGVTNASQYFKNTAGLALASKSITAYMEYLHRYIEIMRPDVISFDHYGLFPNSDRSDYFLNLGLVAEMSKKNKVPFINFIQASRFLADWRMPSPQDMRYLVYTSLAYGAKGIGYYTYWGDSSHEGLYRDGIKSDLASSVAAINLEISKLSDFLVHLNWLGVQHVTDLPLNECIENKNGAVEVLDSENILIGSFCESKKECSIFLAVNLNRSTAQIIRAIIVASGNTLQELSRSSGQWITVATFNSIRRFEFRIEPGDGRLFRVI
jgi:hypothetical protein